MPKAERRRSGVDVVEPIVRVGHGDSDIFRSVAVRVADEGSLVVVVELAVTDGDTGAAVGDIEKTIITVKRK